MAPAGSAAEAESTGGPDWTAGLAALTACGVLPALPPLEPLRRAVSAAMEPLTAPAATPTATAALFPAAALLAAVERCVADTAAIPGPARPATCLLIAAAAQEQHVRAHSTRARLLRTDWSAAAGAAGSAAAAAGGAAAAADDGSLRRFLTSQPLEVVALRLAAVLGEPDSQLPCLLNRVTRFGPEGIETALRRTLMAVRSDDVQRSAGDGRRSLGGVFFKELGRLKAGARLQQAEAQVEAEVAGEGWARGEGALPPLRPYQADVVGLVLSSWGLPLTPQLLPPGGAGATAARDRYSRLCDGWRGNWLVCAPTGSGKTRVFVEVTRALVESRAQQAARPRAGAAPGALVVVLVPTVVLTAQHAAYYRRAALPRTQVGDFSSDNPLSREVWSRVLQDTGRRGAPGGAAPGHWVVVATAASFLNLLQQGHAATRQLDLLVLDEAHHCHDDHPYARVLGHLHLHAPSARDRGDGGGDGPRVLGVTASPASELSMAALRVRMSALLGLLGARLHRVEAEAAAAEAEAGGSAAAAGMLCEPAQEEVRVAQRAADRAMGQVLQEFALKAAADLGLGLQRLRQSGHHATFELRQLQQDLVSAVAASSGAAARDKALAIRLDTLGQWLAPAREFAARYTCPHLALACRLLDLLRKCTELVEEAGYEAALTYLARKTVALVQEEAQLLEAARAAQGAAGGSTAYAAAVARILRPASSDEDEADGSGGGGAVDGGGGGPGEPPLPPLLQELSAAARRLGLPSAHQLAAAAAELRAASTGPQPGNRQVARGGGGLCNDVALRVSALTRELLVEGDGCVLPAGDAGPAGPGPASGLPLAVQLVRSCFASGALQATTHPKYWALVEFLQRYRGGGEGGCYHGIVFVKTRQAVYHLADMIRRTAQLEHVEVYELVGHGSAAGRRTALDQQQDRHGRGMSGSEQQQVLRLFKDNSGRPRCKVLVSTSAAEEGLDVPSCSWVLRYNAAATGIQLLQSRGRARLPTSAAVFVSLLQEHTADVRLHTKARAEERNMREYCSGGGGGGAAGGGGVDRGGSWRLWQQDKKQRL
ncbi:hypothetical protein HXX76_004026 [Chlamydomonas incerta]|uniref:Uncharacterized protein n=1 Tax=Chlamydomonas incerta TaxID=51695 RepID=A0A835T9A5_CHLIN|nr:hypothetical protein HXX76_004026 [Chlamydomonas incerta]|eukprot:KAG2441174.1 hypothetical protein HXX76_004026 [Chlamydomonas incerta]